MSILLVSNGQMAMELYSVMYYSRILERISIIILKAIEVWTPILAGFWNFFRPFSTFYITECLAIYFINTKIFAVAFLFLQWIGREYKESILSPIWRDVCNGLKCFLQEHSFSIYLGFREILIYKASLKRKCWRYTNA